MLRTFPQSDLGRCDLLYPAFSPSSPRLTIHGFGQQQPKCSNNVGELTESLLKRFDRLSSTLAGAKNADDVPLLERLAIVYLILPLVIWLVGWFEWWIGIPAGILTLAALWRPFAGPWRVRLGAKDAAIALLALAWAAIAVSGGVDAHHTTEWDKHRALFLDLSRGNWPTHFAAYFDTPVLLRYYLGFYMAPGLIAAWIGQETLNWTVLLYTWLGISLIIALFVRGICGWKAIAGAALLIGFATLDLTLDVIGLWGGASNVLLAGVVPSAYDTRIVVSSSALQLKEQ